MDDNDPIVEQVLRALRAVPGAHEIAYVRTFTLVHGEDDRTLTVRLLDRGEDLVTSQRFILEVEGLDHKVTVRTHAGSLGELVHAVDWHARGR